MTVQTLNQVHRRYVQLSGAFKSAWTFHQFLQGLRKTMDGEPESYPADFQGLYSRLRSVSQNLNDAEAEDADQQLEEISRDLRESTDGMLAFERQVSPRQLRQFFQRVKNFDDNILGHLVKFYLYFRESAVWEADRLDKADFLVTKLCEEYDPNQDLFFPRDRTHLREVAQGFWAALDQEEVADRVVSDLLEELTRLRSEIGDSESIDHLHSSGMVLRHRRFKHEMGDLVFHPRVMPSVVDTNLALKNLIQRLYQAEEQRIVAEYQEIFELERGVAADRELRGELQSFREVVERFEEQLRSSSVRLEDMATLRRHVRGLLPRLRPGVEATGPFVVPKEVRELEEESSAEPIEPLRPPEYELVEEDYRGLISALEDTNPNLEARKVVLQPEIFSYRLEPREVIAFRRLYGEATCSRELESFLLRCAALRYRMERDVDDIRGVLDDSAVTRDGSVFQGARQTTQLGSLFLHRLEHLVGQQVVAGDPEEARCLQVLQVRMMRTFAGLWLLVHRPA